MLHRIDEVERETDLFVFFTYLYYPTVRGLPRVAEKALLVPTAHDEPPLRLDIFRELFAKTKAFAFNTPEERDLIDRRFGVGSRPQALVGSGVDIPDDILPSRGLDRPFILYVGRISKAKGLEVLCDGFARFKREHGAAELEGPRGRYLGRELELRIAGGGDWARLPRRSDVIREGFVDDARKQELLRDCELMVVPSLYESLSLVLLEAWAYGRAALVERRCAVTRGQVQRSGGGAAYSGSSELSRELRVWLASARAREQAGLAGRRYVQENYAWPAVERRFLAFAEQVLA
jgi:glycosyltransferase involved in cell wall biosynthesis